MLEDVNINFSCNVNNRDESLTILTVENEELSKQLQNAGIFINQMKKERAFLIEEKEDIKDRYKAHMLSTRRGSNESCDDSISR